MEIPEINLADLSRRLFQQDPAQQPDIVHRPRENAERVHRGRIGQDPRLVEIVVRGLVADNSAIGGRTDHRAGRLGPQTHGHHQIGDGRGRARGRAAGRMPGVAGIASRARVQVPELGGDGLAHDHAAGLAQDGDRAAFAHDRCRVVEVRSHHRGQTTHVDDVLHADGDGRSPALSFPDLHFLDHVLVEARPGPDLGLAIPDPLPAGGDPPHRGERARFDPAKRFGRGQGAGLVDVGHASIRSSSNASGDGALPHGGLDRITRPPKATWSAPGCVWRRGAASVPPSPLIMRAVIPTIAG